MLESWILGLVFGSTAFWSAKALCEHGQSAELFQHYILHTCRILVCGRVACHWALAIDPIGLLATCLVRGRA